MRKALHLLEVDHLGPQQGQGIKLVHTPCHPPLPHSDQPFPVFHLRVHGCMFESRINYPVIKNRPYFTVKDKPVGKMRSSACFAVAFAHVEI